MMDAQQQSDLYIFLPQFSVGAENTSSVLRA